MMRKIWIIMLCILYLIFAPILCTYCQMEVDPLTDCEISWNGGGLWTPVPMVESLFLIGVPGKHNPFAVVGVNKFEADVSKVFLSDPNTLLRWKVNIQLPGVTDSVWVTGWIHYRVRAVVGEDFDYSPWSPMQVFHIKTPKQLPAPRLIK